MSPIGIIGRGQAALGARQLTLINLRVFVSKVVFSSRLGGEIIFISESIFPVLYIVLI